MPGPGFPPWPCYSDEEVEAVAGALRSNRVNYWTGQETRAFEREFAAAVGARRGVALANGTVALDLALRALGIGPGDDVVVTPRTFIASVSSVVNAGARPVFADVDPDTQNLSAETVRAALTPAARAVVVVHLAGRPADMDPLVALARERDLRLVEDCAQAHGATYRGRPVGTFGDVAAWSFCQDKIITTGGEGGMVTTDDDALHAAMWAFKDHGKSLAAVAAPAGPGYRWLHESFGTNWRMTELQGVLGRIQTRRLPAWRARRAAHAARIWATAARLDWLRVPPVPDDVEHAAYRAYAFVRPERLPPGWTRDRVIEAIVACGVPAFGGTCAEVYLEKAFDGTGLRPAERLPVARELGETSIAFLVHPTLGDEHVALTCAALERVDALLAAERR